jgi:demethylmenaquinone methyltransferase/2-methoxy-6-polyprenyl-1,4-benzoquinol methylase
MEIKKEQTPEMFDEIAGTYDSLNHILSFGLDKKWRRKFIKNLPDKNYKTIVDIASGTGDLLMNLQNLNAVNYYALDPAENMLNIAKTKVPSAKFIVCTAENIPLPDNSCDLVTISFGVRNFADLNKAFAEIHRILVPNGVISIMEFSQPKFILFRLGFIIYLKLLLPLIGRLVSKNKSAYKYLQSSIFDFAKNIDVFKLLENNNLSKINEKRLLFGVVKIYVAGNVKD